MLSSSLTVIFSDFHAGASESLLTVLDSDNQPVPSQPSPVTRSFATAFNAFMTALAPTTQPDLVILGDALDLSLAPPQTAVQVLQTFLTETGFGDMFQQVSFVAGNHDHELWTAERYGATASGLDPSQPGFWAHSSKAFAPPEAVGTSTLLNAVLSGAGFKGRVASYYPNLGLEASTGTTGAGRITLLHHGHFVETTYTAMSALLGMLGDGPPCPLTAESIEAQNGGWIDFGWSTFGDGGQVGSVAALVEAMLFTGGEAQQLQDRLAGGLAGYITAAAGLPRFGMASEWTGRLSRALTDAVVGAYSDQERYRYDQALSPDSVAGLRRYLSEVVRSQIAEELPNCRQSDDLTFVFGHTHKPFADRILADGFDRPVKVYNTGGWVLDTALLSTVEGAGILFVDEAGNTAMLQLFALSPNENVAPASVLTADPVSDPDNPLRQRMQVALDKTRSSWDAFRSTVTAELHRKQDYYLSQRIGPSDAAPNGGRAA